MGCSCQGSNSASGPYRVQAPNGAITSWRTEAERDAAIARTGGKAV
jgi:hypothetical protein